SSVRSAQSEGLLAQFGSGMFTRKPVLCWKSSTVKRSLGKGDCVVDCRLKRGWVAAAASAGIKTMTAANKIRVRLPDEYFSLRVVCMAVGNLQGELHRGARNDRPPGNPCQWLRPMNLMDGGVYGGEITD